MKILVDKEIVDLQLARIACDETGVTLDELIDILDRYLREVRDNILCSKESITEVINNYRWEDSIIISNQLKLHGHN